MSRPQLISAASAMKLADRTYDGIRDLQKRAADEWRQADPVALSQPQMARIKGRLEALTAVCDLALEARKDIIGDTVGDERDWT